MALVEEPRRVRRAQCATPPNPAICCDHGPSHWGPATKGLLARGPAPVRGCSGAQRSRKSVKNQEKRPRRAALVERDYLSVPGLRPVTASLVSFAEAFTSPATSFTFSFVLFPAFSAASFTALSCSTLSTAPVPASTKTSSPPLLPGT